MKQRYPTHPIWTQSIFSTDEYNFFDNQLKIALTTTNDPSGPLLERAVALSNKNIFKIIKS